MEDAHDGDEWVSSAFLTEVNNEFSKQDTSGRPYEEDPEKGFTMDIMMMMDIEKVSMLRNEFERKGKGLSVAEFVYVMMRFVERSAHTDKKSRLNDLSESQLIGNLCELFAQIDINGDGSMEWEEFTSFIVDTGLTAKSHQPHSIQQYHHVQWEDASKHNTFIDHIYYFSSKDLVALVETCSPYLKFYNVNCELYRTIKSPEGFVQCAEHLPKHNQYIVASSDLQFRFYDDTTLKLTKCCHTPTSQNCLKWYPESFVLFSGGKSGIVQAWNAESMEEKHHMSGEVHGQVLSRSHDDAVLDLLTLPTLESLASASMDRTIRLWDVHTGKLKQQLEGHDKGVRSLAYSPEYRFLVSAGFDFDAVVWNPYVDQLILRLHGHNNSLCGVEIIPGTPQIITADVDGIFKVWDIRNFACMQTFTADNVGEVKSIVSIISSKRILAAGKKIVKFDYEKLENPHLTDNHPVFCALYNSRSLSFVTATRKNVKIWDARLGKLIRVYRNLSSTDLTTICLDFRERKLIVGDHGGNIHVFDYLNGSHMKSFKNPEIGNGAHTAEVTKLCYCADHMSVISVSWDCSISIYDERDSDRGILLRQISGGHSMDITALSFSHHLSLLASGSSDCTLQVWDYEFGRLDATCIGHVSGLLCLQFLDPFPLLLSSDNTGNLCFWAMRPSAQYKGKCVFRFRNQLTQSESVPVNCIATDSIRHTFSRSRTTVGSKDEGDNLDFMSYVVITGDDKGFVSVWNILPLLEHLAKHFDLKPLAKPVECVNAHRNLRVDATSMVRKAHNTPEWVAYEHRDPLSSFLFSLGMPLVANEVESDGENRHVDGKMQKVPPVSLVRRWKAHDDVVYSVQMIKEPKTFISSSFDRQVKLWSLNGDCLGVLMQGGQNPSSSDNKLCTDHSETSQRDWRFTVDYDTREHQKEKISAPVAKVVHAMMHLDKQRDVMIERRRQECVDDSTLEDFSRTHLPSLFPSHAASTLKPDLSISLTSDVLSCETGFIAGRSALVTASPRQARLRSSNNRSTYPHRPMS
ncbi:ef hand family protein [Plasmopara halstedii]|uniref:Ef hand family protein n=1 Tax=Plasmopara halstedii TaxID=4781 RepID=A0A0P1ABD5_PLAHL|nr:ef hand family protein [Plasmopara halstedii]CEG37948.1 ef hand family protein [Plasmopara halstedii]|eukprot:XP_024574317.1 ef hand family protein [Plasmopara halstedii]